MNKTCGECKKWLNGKFDCPKIEYIETKIGTFPGWPKSQDEACGDFEPRAKVEG